MLRKTLSFLPGLGWLAIVSFLLTIPGSALPDEDWLGKIYFDKWVHIGLFAVLVVCWGWGFKQIQTEKSKRISLFFGAAVLATLYGVGMEYVQKYFIPFRSFDIWDIVSDAAGALLGFFFCRKVFIKK